MIDKKSKAKFRLLVRKPVIDEDGIISDSEWVEMKEINLGSKNKPNPNVLEVRIEPIGEEMQEFKGFFKRGFGEW